MVFSVCYTNSRRVVSQIIFSTGLKITYLKEGRELFFLVFIPNGHIPKPVFHRAQS